MSDDTTETPESEAPKWKPINAIDRRVLGVLAEKAKTTPDTYPMSLNGVVTGCNQKSNRAPLMQLEPEDVQESLDRLREAGALGMVEGYGRVTKYRHYLYDWLGVEKVELSVMTELLLRGPQTEGELRGRVSRMDPIADLPALRALLVSLREKGLVISLTPEGRGHVVTHGLYPQRDLDNQRAQYAQQAAAAVHHEESDAAPAARERGSAEAPAVRPAAASRDIEELRSEVRQLRAEMQELVDTQQRMDEELRRLKAALGE